MSQTTRASSKANSDHTLLGVGSGPGRLISLNLSKGVICHTFANQELRGDIVKHTRAGSSKGEKSTVRLPRNWLKRSASRTSFVT